jgi:hypothetical protein
MLARGRTVSRVMWGLMGLVGTRARWVPYAKVRSRDHAVDGPCPVDSVCSQPRVVLGGARIVRGAARLHLSALHGFSFIGEGRSLRSHRVRRTQVVVRGHCNVTDTFFPVSYVHEAHAAGAQRFSSSAMEPFRQV